MNEADKVEDKEETRDVNTRQGHNYVKGTGQLDLLNAQPHQNFRVLKY